jgi:putative transposase
MIAFIDDHRPVYGVEPICRVLPNAPSTDYEHAARRRDPARLPARARRDEVLRTEIHRVWEENVRGKAGKTTISNPAAPCPRDKVNRQFRSPRPNTLWVSDFTPDHVRGKLYVATWQGFVYVAFVIDTFARRIVGWRVSRSAETGFVLDALEQALYDRRPFPRGGLVHHSDSKWIGVSSRAV